MIYNGIGTNEALLKYLVTIHTQRVGTEFPILKALGMAVECKNDCNRDAQSHFLVYHSIKGR